MSTIPLQQPNNQFGQQPMWYPQWPNNQWPPVQQPNNNPRELNPAPPLCGSVA